jgi:hypothetical protein
VTAESGIDLTAVPDRGARFSDGVLVKASILARLLGIRLLKLDASVVVVPAAVRTPSSEPQDSSARVSGDRPAPSPAVPPARSPAVPPARSGAIGGGLADAVRSINEGAALLAESRRNGS